MSTSATYTVNNPSVNQEYIAPSAYWVVPASGSSVTVTVQTFDANGNLLVVSSLTAIRRNISTNSDAGSYIYSNGNTVISTGSVGTNGSNVFAPAGKISSSCAQLRMYITYTGSVYDQAPNAPGNLAPSGTVTTLTPTLSGAFSDPTSGDTLAQYEIVVNNASDGGGSQIWDSGNVTASSSEKSASAFSRVYGGSALAFGSSYSFKARVANQNGNWGPWSGWINFATVQGPDAPSITAPSGQQVSLTPNWSFTYSSPAGTALAAYRLIIQATPAYNWIYDSGWVSQSAASGATVSGALPSAAGLQYGNQYGIAIMVQDANGAQSGWTQGGFNVAALPQVAPASPLGGVTVTTQTPTFAWTYASASGYAQAQAQIEIQNATTGVDIVLTSWLSQSAAQWVSTTSISYGTQIRWRVQVQDSAGLASGWSAWATAYVNNAPSATLTSPAAGGTVVTVTPTVTWTYTPSSGGQAQASAQILLFDASGNPLTTYTQSGAGTNFQLPSGLLINGTTYQIQVTVTDTTNVTGQSGVVTFTVSLIPPADLQGQPLMYGKNYVTEPYLNDPLPSGVANGWSTYGSSSLTTTYSVDPTITQLVPLASGDGFATGAQKVAVTAHSGSSYADCSVAQVLNVAQAGFTPGTTKLSFEAWVQLAALSGNPHVYMEITPKDASYTALAGAAASSNLIDTAGQVVRYLGPQNWLVPTGTVYIEIALRLASPTATDLGTAWWLAAQAEMASTSDVNFIAGDLGTGYSYAPYGYSVRTPLPGNSPTVLAVPGADTDPVNAYGGSIILTWDTTLADTNFSAYLIERRRQDQSTDDNAWQTLATLTNKSQGSYTDYTPAAQTTYQYAVRQQITYSSGGVGVSQHRAIVTGSVTFADAWYLTNAGQGGAPIYNMRLRYVQAKRQLQWKEHATYSAFLGRVGAARDAGAPAGYLHTLACYFTELRGDSRIAIRRQLVAMQRLGGVWYLKDPDGLQLPVFIGDLTFDDEATYSETMLTATLSLLQAADTEDD